MHFTYKDKKLKKSIEENDYSWISKTIGMQMTKTFKKRILQIKASDNFAIYLRTGLGKPHPLEGDLNGCYGISITGNFRLVIEPVTELYDFESLSKCDTVLVKGVTDYHGGKYNWILP
ncbi:MAG TPA: hypothetical protein DDY59_10740 [Lachnospiraceae bacterium]|nr:hypothetical protein [Lachnospiraceae bacterium]